MAAIGAILPVMAIGLQGCGGGGAEKTLLVRFDYPEKMANLWQPVTLDFTATGLEGHPPLCAVLAGTLPKGLAIEPNGCRISGTPAEADILAPTIRLTSPGVKGEVDQQFRFVVQGPSADYAGLGGTVHLGVPYTFSTYGAEASNPAWTPLAGQTLTYKVIDGVLPQGLILDAGSGNISGIPDRAGTYQFTIQAIATSGANVATSPARPYSVNATLPEIGVSYAGIAGKKVGDTLSIQPSIFYPTDAPENKVSLAFRLYPGDQLPPGLSLDERTGAISGTLTGPVPGQNPGQVSSWLYSARFVVSVTVGSFSYTLQPMPYIHLDVAP